MRRQRAKAGLTKRQLRQYQSVLARQGAIMVESLCITAGPRRRWIERGDGYLAASAWAVAHQFGGRREVDLVRLQTIIIQAGIAKWAYKFARDIPGANIKRLAKVVMRDGSAKCIRLFAQNVPGANKQQLETAAIVREVMEM